jgi:hypothetical protein
MKLKNELKEMEQRFSKLDINDLNTLLKQLKESKQYNCLKTRFVWVLVNYCYTSSELIQFYDKYDATDKHIDTLAKKGI